jgi:hypothetical protein
MWTRILILKLFKHQWTTIMIVMPSFETDKIWAENLSGLWVWLLAAFFLVAAMIWIFVCRPSRGPERMNNSARGCWCLRRWRWYCFLTTSPRVGFAAATSTSWLPRHNWVGFRISKSLVHDWENVVKASFTFPHRRRQLYLQKKYGKEY